MDVLSQKTARYLQLYMYGLLAKYNDLHGLLKALIQLIYSYKVNRNIHNVIACKY